MSLNGFLLKTPISSKLQRTSIQNWSQEDVYNFFTQKPMIRILHLPDGYKDDSAVLEQQFGSRKEDLFNCVSPILEAKKRNKFSVGKIEEDEEGMGVPSRNNLSFKVQRNCVEQLAKTFNLSYADALELFTAFLEMLDGSHM